LSREFSPEIDVIHSSEIEANYPRHWGGRLSVSFADGSVLEDAVCDAKGDPENRLTNREMHEKAETMMVQAGVVRPAELVAAILATATGGVMPDIGGLVCKHSS